MQYLEDFEYGDLFWLYVIWAFLTYFLCFKKFGCFAETIVKSHVFFNPIQLESMGI